MDILREVAPMAEQCPCCLRPLEKMQDYPLVLVCQIEKLPIPEFIDRWSAEAAQAQLRLSGNELPDQQRLFSRGINRTPEIAAAYESQEVQSYLSSLEGYQGQEVSPAELAPQLKASGYFKWAYSIPGTKLYLSLSEGEPEGAERTCEVVFHGEGPNLGSGGGPTLQEYGRVAVIRYQGRLMARG
jgi:hypothetical protein